MKALMMALVPACRYACPSSFVGPAGSLSTCGMGFLYSWSTLTAVLPLVLLISMLGFELCTELVVWLLKIFFIPKNVSEHYVFYVKWKFLHWVFSSALQVITQIIRRVIIDRQCFGLEELGTLVR